MSIILTEFLTGVSPINGRSRKTTSGTATQPKLSPFQKIPDRDTNRETRNIEAPPLIIHSRNFAQGERNR